MMDSLYFLKALRETGIQLGTGTPCSYLKPLYNSILADVDFPFLEAHNEGDAVALAAGSWLGGKTACGSFQNSGLGNAVNPLTSLCLAFQIPQLLLVTHRGQPNGPADEPQHEQMGAMTQPLLSLMGLKGISWGEESALVAELHSEMEAMQTDRIPRYLVLPKNGISASEKVGPFKRSPGGGGKPPELPTRESRNPKRTSSELLVRREVLAFLLAQREERDLLIATTGYTGRELYVLEDHPAHFYMAGSMGCASALGLGLALAQPDRRVIVLDGDGALLMRLGNLGLIGYHQPANLIHCLLDNGIHESTGGQPTLSSAVDFPALAQGCGYSDVRIVSGGLSDFQDTWGTLRSPGPSFIYIPTRSTDSGSLPRPELTFPELAARFREYATS